MNEHSFFYWAVETLDNLEKQLIIVDSQGILDIERLGQDALEISYKDISSKTQTYLLNVRSSLKQIWLSSPVSGPSHFVCQKDGWKNAKDMMLEDLLSSELGKVLHLVPNLKPKSSESE